MKELLHDLCNLEEVNAVPYEPESPKVNLVSRATLTATSIIMAICLVIIIFGLLAQFIHHTARWQSEMIRVSFGPVEFGWSID